MPDYKMRAMEVDGTTVRLEVWAADVGSGGAGRLPLKEKRALEGAKRGAKEGGLGRRGERRICCAAFAGCSSHNFGLLSLLHFPVVL